ncbi:hypothetical protein [Streptomyces sp. NBC_01500]|uniref:hypothetical protein n=1 Tax=Streptomyces sp. NBC_01500 TaxID=2903886 RepID=UPI0022504801|nr:hypothetical protein [Streptomyces sp. NBC_01500]MCX4554216.1 hypothetical protein [Streptomyces sp. NBC_01500]
MDLPLFITPDQPTPPEQLGVWVPMRTRTALEVESHEWQAAPLVVVDDQAVGALVERGLPRRTGIVVLVRDEDDASIWERAVAVGAEYVVQLPLAAAWLELRLHEATGCAYVMWDQSPGEGPCDSAPTTTGS